MEMKLLPPSLSLFLPPLSPSLHLSFFLFQCFFLEQLCFLVPRFSATIPVSFFPPFLFYPLAPLPSFLPSLLSFVRPPSALRYASHPTYIGGLHHLHVRESGGDEKRRNNNGHGFVKIGKYCGEFPKHSDLSFHQSFYLSFYLSFLSLFFCLLFFYLSMSLCYLHHKSALFQQSVIFLTHNLRQSLCLTIPLTTN